MEYVGIGVIAYAAWRLYENYKNNIKSFPEISLLVGGFVASLGNMFFKDNFIVTILQLVLMFLVSLHIGRITRKSN